MSQGAKKTGSNKGIARAHRERKREEAEARNERTLPENRRAYRIYGVTNATASGEFEVFEVTRPSESK